MWESVFTSSVFDSYNHPLLFSIFCVPCHLDHSYELSFILLSSSLFNTLYSVSLKHLYHLYSKLYTLKYMVFHWIVNLRETYSHRFLVSKDLLDLDALCGFELINAPASLRTASTAAFMTASSTFSTDWNNDVDFCQTKLLAASTIFDRSITLSLCSYRVWRVGISMIKKL